MNKDDRDKVVALYEDRFKEHGANVKTLGWNTPQDQQLRFGVLASIGDLKGKSICDVGSGFGDLYGYLLDRAADIRYTGIELAPSLVDESARRFPNARFLNRDILDESFAERFDYMLLSGALSFRISDNLAHSRAVISRMFALCNEGIGLNFLTTYVNFQRAHNYHYDPEQMFKYARTLTPWVVLRHDYPLWEFTIFLYKMAQQPAIRP